MFQFIPAAAYEAPPFLPEIHIVPETPIEKSHIPPSPLKKASIVLAIIGLVFIILAYGPSLYYTLRGSEKISQILRNTVAAHDLPLEKKYSYQPQFDSNLPVTNSISIPRVGIKTSIEEALDDNYEDALRHGVWRVNDFGTPYNRELPTIMAAHRYGYLNWSLDFRLHSSFYELPNVKDGDIVEVIWRQRKYVYGVYKKETSTEISDYSADLILYTCQDLSSEARVFVYAKLLEV